MGAYKKTDTNYKEAFPIDQQLKTLVNGFYEDKKKAMKNLSAKDPEQVLNSGIDMYKRGKGEDYLFHCSFALLNNNNPEQVFKCLKHLFKINSDMYMLEAFIPTICELEIDDKEREGFLLELAKSDDNYFKEALKGYLEDVKPNRIRKAIEK